MAAPARVRYVHADDGTRLSLTSIRAERATRGAVLLLHGFSQNRRAFLHGHLPSTLAGLGFDVHMGELRGHGLSDRPRGWDLDDHLRLDVPCLAAAAARLSGVERLHLVGHSMGGMLGYASLVGAHRWASLTALAAPLRLGRGSPLVGLAARAVAPAAWLVGRRPVPMDQFLSLLSDVLSARSSSLPLQALQRVVALANPWEVEPELIRAVLRSSDPESMTVFRAFLVLALGARPRLSGVDLEDAVRAASVPVAAVVGARDIFAPPPSVDPLLEGRHAGPRRVVALPRASHVDLTVGRAVATAVGRLVGFWEVP